MRVRGRDEQLVLVDRHVALGERVAAFGDELRRQVALVLPDEIAAGGIERLHLVGVVEDEEDAVVHDRRRLGRAIGQRPGPDQLEILDVGLVDLLERAVAPCVVGSPPHQPVAGGRIAQHVVGDRRNIAGRLPPLLGQARRHRQGEKRQSQRGCLQKTLKHRRSPPLLWLLTRHEAYRSEDYGRYSVHASRGRPRVNRVRAVLAASPDRLLWEGVGTPPLVRTRRALSMYRQTARTDSFGRHGTRQPASLKKRCQHLCSRQKSVTPLHYIPMDTTQDSKMVSAGTRHRARDFNTHTIFTLE